MVRASILSCYFIVLIRVYCEILRQLLLHVTIHTIALGQIANPLVADLLLVS